jgi:hypothetical protein
VSKKKAREIEEQKRKNRNKVLTVVIASGTLVIVLFLAYLLFFNGNSDDGKLWHLDNAGLLSFGEREPPAWHKSFSPVTLVEDTPEYTLEEESYISFNDTVFALLRVPKNETKPPVVIVLPGAGINKEADADMAKALCSWGYATVTLDERGNNGSTPGPSPMDLNSGYSAFVNGDDPVQYKQVYDVLLAYDCIRSMPILDGENVAVLGESMGGRFAIVSAALEPGLKAVVAVSGGPYGLKGDDDASTRFLKSIEPANYLSKLPQRKLIMFHFTDDPIIPLASGRQLYDAASQPKAWHQYNGSVHGIYSDVYAADLHNELKGVFGR